MSTRWTPPIALSSRETTLCRKLEKHRRFFRLLRLHRHHLFAEGFEDKLLALYSDSPRGTPPKPPALMATVVLLQAYTQASDDDAVQLAETDARWQMVLDCLGRDDAPFKKSTLVDFRRRLVAAGFYPELVQRTADLARRSGDFDPKQLTALRVAVDSLPLQGAGRVEDTLNLLARALRLLAVAVAAAVVMAPTELYAAAGLRILAAPSPKAGLDRDWDEPGATDAALTDLMHEVERLRRWMDTQPPALVQQRAVHAAQAQLARMIAQDTEPCASGGHRVVQDTAPDRQLSLFDPDMRHGRKSKSQRINGYKVYLAHDLDADVTLAAGVLPANAPELEGADKLQPWVCAHGTVAELHVDRAFLTSRWVQHQAARRLDSVVCRAPAPRVRPDRYGKHDFAIDVAHATVRCPAGQQTTIETQGTQLIAVFRAAQCGACAQRPRCQDVSQAPRRRIEILPYEALHQRAAQTAKTPAGRQRLRERVVVEHANAHYANRVRGAARYVGIPKNDFDAGRTVAVTNLQAMDRKLRTREQAATKVAA